MGSIVALLILTVLGWLLASSVRRRASASPAYRTRMFIGGSVCLAAGLASALWITRSVPATDGSPASLVAMVMLWLVGGGFALVGVASLVGAFLARPGADNGPLA